MALERTTSHTGLAGLQKIRVTPGGEAHIPMGMQTLGLGDSIGREWISLLDVSYHVSFHTPCNDCWTGSDHHRRHCFWGPLRHLGDGGIAMLAPDVRVICETETELKTKSTAHLCNSEAQGMVAQRGDKFQ